MTEKVGEGSDSILRQDTTAVPVSEDDRPEAVSVTETQ